MGNIERAVEWCFGMDAVAYAVWEGRTMKRDRLDIDMLARDLERRINRPKYRHGSSMKAAFISGGQLVTYGADTRSYDYYLTHHARHCIGVYSPGVTLDELRDDIAQVLP